jgi:hypothetical protein
MKWLLAFAIAYVIVKHGGELLGAIGATGGNLTSIVSLLLA